MIRLLIAQEHFRFYRAPLLRRISEDPDVELTVIHGTNAPVNKGEVGLTVLNTEMPFRVIKKPIPAITLGDRQALWFGSALRLIREEVFDIVIHDYFCRFLSIWPMQSFQRRHKRGFILWGIGFHLHPSWLTDNVRLAMVARSDALILYGPTERDRYLSLGVPEEKLFVARNTVDIDGIDAGIAAATEDRQAEIKKRLGVSQGPLLLHSGRLAPVKRLDLLLKSLQLLLKRWPGLKLVLIGEGPERAALTALARSLGVDNAVHFAGAITDPVDLAPYVLASDLVVAPAQIGLQAPMALAYGKPLVVSDDPSASGSGPEYQVFVPGKTGLSYSHLDLDDLPRAVGELLSDPARREEMGRYGFRRVREEMASDGQVDGFLQAIRAVHARRDWSAA
jgi:glycosyltransferase involved in cell wall biosynthesis